MTRHLALLLLLAAVPLLPAADELRGRLWLKDAANGDARVGPGMQEGIPQGHVLKVALGGAQVGRKAGPGGTVLVVLRDGARELARAVLSLDASGYGETSFPIGMAMAPGVYQVHLGVGDGGQQTGLGGPFRVIEAAPPPNLPFGAAGAILALAALAFGLLAAWRRPRRA